MELSTEVALAINLKLNEKEAEFLRDVLRNALSDEESSYEKRIRLCLFKGINGALKKKGERNDPIINES